jgi:hypothetical protein
MSRLGIRRAADGTGWEDALADLPPCRVDDRIEVIIESDESEAEPEEVVENAADVADGAGEVEFEVGKAAEIDDEPSDPPARLRAVDDGVNEPAHSHPAAERTLFDDLQDYGEDAAEDSPAITTAWDEPREPSVPSEPTDESPPEPQSSVAVEAECSLSQALPAPERDAPALEVMLETDSPEAGSEPITEPEPEAEAQTAAEPLSREVSPVEGSSEDTDESAESGTEAEIEGTELKPSKADVETEADVDDEEEDEDGAVEDGEDDEYEYVYEYEYVDEEPDGDDDVEVIRVPEDED